MVEGNIALKMKYFVFVGILAVIILTAGIPLRVCAAEDVDYIRVGLKEHFENKSSVSIYNSSLKMGYCINNSFSEECLIRTENGITITPDNGTYSKLSGYYGSYSSARAEAASYSALYTGNAFAVSAGPGKWFVYVLTSSGKNTGNILKVSTGRGYFLIDAAAAGCYPQFEDSYGNPLTLSENASYRGRIEVGTYGKDLLTAVNVLPIEDYLYGVVPCEMVSTWPAEALKAQAVCARSYGMKSGRLGSSGYLSRPYRIGDTEDYQVYRGTAYENARTNKAVDDTRGVTVCYKNKVIKAYYFASSGGYTEDAQDVWGVSIPYLKGVKDEYESDSRTEKWSVTFTDKELTDRLKRKNKNVGTVKDVVCRVITQSGRVSELSITGSSGKEILKTNEIRTVLGLKSTMFKLFKKNKGENVSFTFEGKGYGHGVGMPQLGAKGMAEAGYSYKDILKHYYYGIEII